MFSRINNLIHFLAQKIFKKFEMVFPNYLWLHFANLLSFLKSFFNIRIWNFVNLLVQVLNSNYKRNIEAVWCSEKPLILKWNSIYFSIFLMWGKNTKIIYIYGCPKIIGTILSSLNTSCLGFLSHYIWPLLTNI